MSTCPEKELLSAYIDNEISSPWLEQVCTHIKDCPSCAAHIQHYEKLRSSLEREQTVRDLTEEDMGESFKRLKARLSYKQVVSPAENIKSVFFRRIVPAMAAAAVFAWVLPMQKTNHPTQSSNQASIRHTPARKLPKNTGVVSDGTLTHAELASMIGGRPESRTINLKLQDVPLFSFEAETEAVAETSPYFYISIGNFMPTQKKTVFEKVQNITYIPEIRY